MRDSPGPIRLRGARQVPVCGDRHLAELPLFCAFSCWAAASPSKFKLKLAPRVVRTHPDKVRTSFRVRAFTIVPELPGIFAGTNAAESRSTAQHPSKKSSSELGGGRKLNMLHHYRTSRIRLTGVTLGLFGLVSSLSGAAAAQAAQKPETDSVIESPNATGTSDTEPTQPASTPVSEDPTKQAFVPAEPHEPETPTLGTASTAPDSEQPEAPSTPRAPGSWSLVRCNPWPCQSGFGVSNGTNSGTKDSRPASDSKRTGSTNIRTFGASFDVGVPDGIMMGFAARPWSWVRAQAAVGTNGISPGIRGGVALRLPTQISPSLTLEAGQYFEGNANGLASKVVGSSYQSSPMADKIGYQFANLHLGVEFGNERSILFVHGGMSYLHAQLHHVNDALQGNNGPSDTSTVIAVNGDPRITAWVPSIKLGFLLYLV